MEKVFRYITIGIFVFLLLWSAIGTGCTIYWSAKYHGVESELGQLRAELESAVDNKRQLTEQIDTLRTITGECIDYVGREREILLTGGTTITEIRASVSDLEEYCDRLECYIYNIGSNLNDRANNTKQEK